MKTRLCRILLAALCLQSAFALDLPELADFLVGDYILVGRKPDSQETYTGRIGFVKKVEKLAVTRMVGGHTIHGTAVFETVAGSDKIPVLRMRFVQDGRAMEGIFVWKTDYDNYARLSG